MGIYMGIQSDTTFLGYIYNQVNYWSTGYQHISTSEKKEFICSKKWWCVGFSEHRSPPGPKDWTCCFNLRGATLCMSMGKTGCASLRWTGYFHCLVSTNDHKKVPQIQARFIMWYEVCVKFFGGFPVSYMVLWYVYILKSILVQQHRVFSQKHQRNPEHLSDLVLPSNPVGFYLHTNLHTRQSSSGQCRSVNRVSGDLSNQHDHRKRHEYWVILYNHCGGKWW